jgi:hypothetical protein
MDEPILLICGCQKYKQALFRAIKRFQHPSYRVIGIVGDLTLPTHFNGVYLSLQVEDTYEALPMKIHAAFAWIHINYPNAAGIFKTDDDIHFENINTLVEQIQIHKSVPYWGHRIISAPAGPYRDSDYKRYSISVRPMRDKSHYCAGNGYWVSKLLIPIVVNSKLFQYGAEDSIMGTVLNGAGYIPVLVSIVWYQYRNLLANNTCLRDGCNYKIHSNPANNNGLYCCRACQGGGGHGPACEKILDAT